MNYRIEIFLQRPSPQIVCALVRNALYFQLADETIHKYLFQSRCNFLIKSNKKLQLYNFVFIFIFERKKLQNTKKFIAFFHKKLILSTKNNTHILIKTLRTIANRLIQPSQHRVILSSLFSISSPALEEQERSMMVEDISRGGQPLNTHTIVLNVKFCLIIVTFMGCYGNLNGTL